MKKNIIIIILSVVIITLLIIVIKLFSNTPVAKGKRGERKVTEYLKKLSSRNYIILNDILLQNKIFSTQIDHIVFSVYGIFVIETKNYSGLIKGTEKAENWTKTSYGKEYDFRNPILQNESHIKALKHILSIRNDRNFISIIAFSKRANLNVHTSSHVVYYDQINRVISGYKKRVFSKSEIINYSEKIKRIAKPNSFRAKQVHIKRVKEKQNIYDKKIARGICPKCNRKLIKRKNKYGKFMLCSDYPKCNFIKKL